MQALDRTRLRPGSLEASRRHPATRPSLGKRSKSEPGHPTTRSETTSRPNYRRVISDWDRAPLRSLTVTALSLWSIREPSNYALEMPSLAQATAAKSLSDWRSIRAPQTPGAYPICASPSEDDGIFSASFATLPLHSGAVLTDAKPPIPRSSSMPIRGGNAKPRIQIPKPDATSWFGGELLERVHLSLRPLPGARQIGRARVCEADGRTLVLSSLSNWDTPGSQRFVSQLLTVGLTNFGMLVMRHEGLLRRVNSRGALMPMPDGLYTFGIDQDDRFLVSLQATPAATAERSAQGRPEDGACGSHGNLLANLPGKFFGEVQIAKQQAVAYNNRSSTYMTPAQLAAQIAGHEILADAIFFPVTGGS